jgi:hypothetical protein
VGRQAEPRLRGEAAENGTKIGEKGAEKKTPFTDRVLDKALDYVRGEIRKAAAPQAAPANKGAERRPAREFVLPAASGRAALEFRTRPEFIGGEDLR